MPAASPAPPKEPLCRRAASAGTPKKPIAHHGACLPCIRRAAPAPRPTARHQSPQLGWCLPARAPADAPVRSAAATASALRTSPKNPQKPAAHHGASVRCASTHSACSTVSRTTPSARSSAGAPPPGAPAAARTRSAAAAASAGGRLSSAAASDSSRRCAAGRGVNGANAAASVWQSARKRRAPCSAGRS